MGSWRVSRTRAPSAPQTLLVPGDKSISHRAAMLATLALGESEIVNFLPGSDCLATIGALEKLGGRMTWLARDRLLVRGGQQLRSPGQPLDCGNSGTAMRLLAGLMAGQNVAAQLHGDDSLSRRPMHRVVDPLSRMGARIEALGQDGRPPLRIDPGEGLRGISFAPPVPSAQVKSAILLAGLGARGETSVRESTPTRDHTERMLPSFGVSLERANGSVSLAGRQPLRAARVNVPGDFSSAAFLLLAGVIGQVEVRTDSVGINPGRTGFLQAMERMGAGIRILARRQAGAEPVADLVAAPVALRGARLPASLVPSAIDEMPAVFAAAACARGQTVIQGAAELRVKESDRIAAMAAGLRALGVECQETPDGARINGGSVRGGEVDAQGDHRIAMAFSILALAAKGPVTVKGVELVDTSFPGFTKVARSLGLSFESIG